MVGVIKSENNFNFFIVSPKIQVGIPLVSFEGKQFKLS